MSINWNIIYKNGTDLADPRLYQEFKNALIERSSTVASGYFNITALQETPPSGEYALAAWRGLQSNLESLKGFFVNQNHQFIDTSGLITSWADEYSFPQPSGWTRKYPKEIYKVQSDGTNGERAIFAAYNGSYFYAGNNEYIPPSFVSSTYASGLVHTPEAERTYAGLYFDYINGSGWIISEDQNTPMDIITTSGVIRPGDYAGPWILNDLQKAINHLTWTCQSAEYRKISVAGFTGNSGPPNYVTYYYKLKKDISTNLLLYDDMFTYGNFIDDEEVRSAPAFTNFFTSETASYNATSNSFAVTTDASNSGLYSSILYTTDGPPRRIFNINKYSFGGPTAYYYSNVISQPGRLRFSIANTYKNYIRDIDIYVKVGTDLMERENYYPTPAFSSPVLPLQPVKKIYVNEFDGCEEFTNLHTWTSVYHTSGSGLTFKTDLLNHGIHTGPKPGHPGKILDYDAFVNGSPYITTDINGNPVKLLVNTLSLEDSAASDFTNTIIAGRGYVWESVAIIIKWDVNGGYKYTKDTPPGTYVIPGGVD